MIRMLGGRLAANWVALWVATSLLTGLVLIDASGQGRKWLACLVVALVLTLVNSFVRPLLTLLSFPLIVVTLGLFLIVVNALMLLLTDRITASFTLGLSVEGFGTAFWGAVIIGIVNWMITLVFDRDGQDSRRRR